MMSAGFSYHGENWVARSITRPLPVRLGVLALVLAFLGALPVAPAFADDPEPTEPAPTTTTTTEPTPTTEPAPTTTTEPTPTTTAPTTSEPAPTSTPSFPPSFPIPDPAPPDPPPATPGLPDLQVTLALDKARYLGSDQVKMTVILTNRGDVDAPNVTGWSWGDVYFGYQPGELAAPGILVRARETRTVELTGYITWATDHVITVGLSAFPAGGDANGDDNSATARATLVDATGGYGGTIFTDNNLNGHREPGENGLSGVTVRLSGGLPWRELTRTTDGQGRFSFTDVPTGRYYLRFDALYPWIVVSPAPGWFDQISIDDSGRYADVSLPAMRRLASVLEVSLWFDRDAYRVGDPVHVTVVLSNRGERELTGVTAHCANTVTDAGMLRGGPGWGLLAEGGPGVTLPPGHPFGLPTTRSFSATETVPAAAADFGQVSAFCFFSAAGYLPDDRTFDDTSARVTGPPAGGHGQVFQDRNDNGWPDAGEGLVGAPLVLTDQDTGAAVARPVTDADGGFTVDGLSPGSYDLRVDGRWKPRFGRNWFQFRVAAVPLNSSQNFNVVPGTERENQLPNLKAFAAFDKPAYNSGDVVNVRISVTNIGAGVAEGVHALACGGSAGVSCDPNRLGDLYQPMPGMPGVRIEPGETRTAELTGKVSEAYAGVLAFGISFETTNGDVNPANNTFRVIVPMTATRGSYSGILYGDRNGNGLLDPGEELERIRVSLHGGVPDSQFDGATDAHGRFAFPDIPTGQYGVSYELPAGWTPPNSMVTVDEQDDGDILIRLDRPLFQVLQASIKFTKDSYTEGEVAHITFTLTNRGPATLTGVTAFCTGSGTTNEIDSGGPGWVDIGDDGWMTGPEVTLGSGETRSFDVWDVIPEGARTWGYAFVGCEFGLNHVYPQDRSPTGYAEARVPGATGTGGGRVIYDRDDNGFTEGEGLPGVKLVLVEPGTGTVIARTTTDPGGRYLFSDLPAYHYELRIVGPWQFTGPGNAYFQVYGGENLPDSFDVFVVPGPDQSDPDAPLPQAALTPAAAALTNLLAATGTDVLDLLFIALTTLAAGLALLFIRRRRDSGRTIAR
jgi:hypothetical protein